MPKSVNQKQKLLFLLDYLRQNTDETHTVTTPQIIAPVSYTHLTLPTNSRV